MKKYCAWFLLVCCFGVAATGCGKAVEKNSVSEETESIFEVQNNDDNKADIAVSDTATEKESIENPYEQFINGNSSVYFDYYTANVFKDSEYLSYVDEFLSYIPSDRGYTLTELRDQCNAVFHSEDTYYYEEDITSMEYAYIDCGNDGNKELSLRMEGSFVEPQSILTLIIKNIDYKLEVVYAYVSWSRSSTDINEYGFISGDGSNGASNHGWDAAYINADGKYQFGFYEEQEYDFNSFAYFKEHDEFDLSELEGNIMAYSLRLHEYSEDAPEADYYTYEVSSKDTYQDMDVPDLYTNSPYKDVVDTLKGLSFVTMDEFNQIKDEKLKSIGVTDEIKNGAYPEYINISFG